MAGKKFDFYPDNWLVDFIGLTTEQRGFYFTLCMSVILNGGEIDDIAAELGRRCGCTKAKAIKLRGELIQLRRIRSEDGKIVSDKCSEIVAEVRRSERRLPWPEWAALRRAVFARDGNCCTYCGEETGPFECDHVVPVSRGGTNNIDNLTTACVTCNRGKRDLTVEEWRQIVATTARVQ